MVVAAISVKWECKVGALFSPGGTFVRGDVTWVLIPDQIRNG